MTMTFPSSTSSHISTASRFMTDRQQSQNVGKWKNFRRFIWNKEKRTFCDRTCLSWGKVICFYLTFLLLLWITFLLLVYAATNYITGNYKLPWIDKQSWLKDENPGVAFMPNIIRENSPLLWYTFQGSQSSKNMHYFKYVEYINNYFEKYDEAEKHIEDYSDCETRKLPNKSCIFRKSDMGPCGSDKFGYADKKPCIYIKLNKLPKWVPEYYNDDNLPHKMPDSLQQVIKNDSDKNKVWIHCGGIFPPDEEHMGKVTYYPYQGIKGYYFPYTGDKKYLTPLVAVKIDNIKKGRVVDIRCSAWAKNIKYDDYKTHSTDIHMYLAQN